MPDIGFNGEFTKEMFLSRKSGGLCQWAQLKFKRISSDFSSECFSSSLEN